MTSIERPAIGIIAQAEMARINMAIMGVMRNRYGFKTFLYTSGIESVRSHQHYVTNGVLDGIVVVPPISSAYFTQGLDRDQVVARAASYESRTGCPFGQLFMTRRELGIGFALGGVNHMLSPIAAQSDYIRSLHAETESLAFWEREIADKKLFAILNGPKSAAVMARTMAVNFRWLYATRYKNFYYWARNEFMELPNLERVFRTLPDTTEPRELEGQYFQDKMSRKRFSDQSPYKKMLRDMAVTMMRRLRLRVKGYLVGNEYNLVDQLGYQWRFARARKHIGKRFAVTIADLEGQPFVYFPLQTEPEFSLQTMSPEYFFQLEAIASIARDLPAGTVLAVKEALYALGRRPRDFYRALELIPNVVLLDMNEPGWKVATCAQAVATISGTGGLEAAMTGVPVILFGRHNGYEFLDHVYPVWKYEDLRPALLSALSPSFDRKKAALNGAKLTMALEAISFDMGEFNTVDLCSYTQSTIDIACKRLIDSFPRCNGNEPHADSCNLHSASQP